MLHLWGPSRLNHGNQQCRICLITDLEAQATGSVLCYPNKLTAMEVKRPQLTVIQGGKRA
jgi:hypothetical protein